jgi:hypothetical protein
MATKTELNKILIVLAILVVLFIGLFLIRSKRSQELLLQQQKIEGEKQSPTGVVPTTTSLNSVSGVVRITPVRTSVKVGEEFMLSVGMEADGLQLDGADIHLKFNPSVIEIIDLTPGTYFEQYPRNTIDNVSGTIKISAFSSSLLPKLTQAQELFTVKGRAKKVGSDQIMVDFSQGKTSSSNLVEHKTSKNVLEKVENAMIVVGE